MLIITIFLLVIALGLAFSLGWFLGQRRHERMIAAPLVRFSFDLPPDTPPGDAVYLTGAFNNWDPADPQYVCTRTVNSATGAWVFKAGQTHEYKLTRGSWTTVEKAAGHLELANRVFTARPKMQVQGTVAVWADQNHDAAHVYDPRVERIQIQSSELGISKTVFVYLPPEVQEDPTLRVPCIYLLRGHEREWINPYEDSSRQGQRNVLDVYADLRAADLIGPLILVFPGMTSANGAIHSLGINMYAADQTNDASIGSGRFEAYFIDELIPYIEAQYPVLPGGQHRAIDGFSLGGFMSVSLALRNAGAFCSVGSYDGLFFWDDPDQGMTIAATDTVFTRPLFDPDFGVPRAVEFAAVHNPLTILQRDGVAAQNIQWLVEFGPEHAEPGVNYYRGLRLIELLHQHGLVNELGGAVADGDHSWQKADEHMRRALPIHWEAIKP